MLKVWIGSVEGSVEDIVDSPLVLGRPLGQAGVSTGGLGGLGGGGFMGEMASKVKRTNAWSARDRSHVTALYVDPLLLDRASPSDLLGCLIKGN